MSKKIRRVGLCALLTLAMTLAGVGGRASQTADCVRVVTVMTYNVDEGTDLAPVLSATTLAELASAACSSKHLDGYSTQSASLGGEEIETASELRG